MVDSNGLGLADF